MTKETNTITFIIVNYKSVQELKRCLSDLSKIKNSNTFQIIIINNDKQRVSLPKNTFETQKVIEINQNIGFGSACNKGLRHAKNKFVCFLNPDTHSFCKNLSDITNFLEEKTIVSPKILINSTEIEPWSVGDKITLLQTLKNNLGLSQKKWLSQKNIDVYWVSGAALFSTTKFLKELNGFDEDFFLYFEDVDLCHRAQKLGARVQYLPQFYLTHTNGVSSKNSIQKQKKCYYTSQDLFFKKHLGFVETHLMRFFRFLFTK